MSQRVYKTQGFLGTFRIELIFVSVVYGGPWVSRQNQIPHGKTKTLTAKPKTSRQNQKTSRQNQKPHGKTKNLTAKPKDLTAKPKTSRQNQACCGGSNFHGGSNCHGGNDSFNEVESVEKC